MKNEIAENLHEHQKFRPGCQLKKIYEDIDEITADLTLRDRVKLLVLQQKCEMRGRIERRLKSFPRKNPLPDIKDLGETELRDKTSSKNLEPGDLVKIRSIREIEKALDSKRCTRGLWFMPGMKEFCGLNTRILRKVNYFFDERAWGMVKCVNNVYLLENAICTGKWMFEKEGCDRCCFFFWHEAWFEKL